MARFDRWPCERRPLLDPIIGARIEQLTAYPAHHWHLSAPDTPLTPAGDSLLFVSDRAGGLHPNLFRLQIRTGAIEQVTGTDRLDPEAVTPAVNGREPVASRAGEEGELDAIDLETGDWETLAVFLRAGLDGCHRSAAGEYVVTVVTQEGEGTITAVHTEGMRTVPILGELHRATAARFSPDSKHSVLYVTAAPAALRCVEFDGTGDRELYSGVQAFGVRCSARSDRSDRSGPNTEHRTPNTEHRTLNACPPSWLGAGDEVLFIAGSGPGPIMAVPRQGGSPREISPLPCRWVRSNGTGDRLVALAADRIVLIDPRSGGVRPLCSGCSAWVRPCFSPDGRWVVYADRDAQGYSQLFLAFLDEE